MRERHNALGNNLRMQPRGRWFQFWWNRFFVSTALGAAKD